MIDESKVVLVDIDDVLWNLGEAWIDWLNKKYNRTVKYEDCCGWSITSLFPGLTYEEVFTPLYIAEFWETVSPKKDAQEYLPKLQELGYTIKLVSATKFKEVGAKIDKILNYFPTITSKDIIICYDKWLVKGAFLIDDNINNLAEREFPILMTAWHNRNIDVQKPMIRVSNWEEIYNLLK